MTREQIIESFVMKMDGKSYQNIADTFGVSKQRVEQVLANVILPRKSLKSVIYPNIKAAMRERNLSVAALERAIGMKRKKLQRVLTGNQNMSVECAKQLSDYFNMSFEEVIEV